MVKAGGVQDFGALKVLKGVTLRGQQGRNAGARRAIGQSRRSCSCINHLEQINGRTALYVDGELVGYQGAAASCKLSPATPARQRRDDIGMVFQHFNLFPHRTALANIIGRRCKVKVKRVGRTTPGPPKGPAMSKGGVGGKADAYPSATLKRAAAKRVRHRRALAMEPKLMLFDEPHLGAGPRTGRRGAGRRMKALASGSMTMVVVTHEMGFAAGGRPAGVHGRRRHRGAGPPREVLATRSATDAGVSFQGDVATGSAGSHRKETTWRDALPGGTNAQLLGRGGMGEVYRAREHTDRIIALKVLPVQMARGDTVFQERVPARGAGRLRQRPACRADPRLR